MNLTVEEVNRMKVVELRAELQVRGLDPKGVKAVLVDRLLAALGQAEGSGSAAGGGGVAVIPSVGNGSSGAALDLPGADLDESKGEEEVDSGKVGYAPSSPMKIPESMMEDIVPQDSGALFQQDQDQSMNQSLPSQSNEMDEEGNANVEEEAPEADNEEPEGEGANADEQAEMPEGDQEETEQTTAVAENETMETDQDGDTSKRKIEVINGGETSDENKFKKQKIEESIVFKHVPLNEPEFDENAVLLDWCKLASKIQYLIRGNSIQYQSIS